jgi:hypothetical protein
VGHERIIRYCLLEARHQAELGLAPFHRYVCEDGTVWTEFYRTDTGYILRFPDLADFGISADGTDVIAHPAEGEDAATVVTVPGGAVAFLGKTGMGKSTLAASFALNDAAFLTDDALLIEETDKSCRALPSHASLRLWDDSVKELVGPHSMLAAEISYSSKARLLAGKALAYRDEPQCLLAAFLLERQRVTKVSIRSLAGSESHMAWLRNSFLLDIEDRELLAQHFDWTLRIADTVPTFALDYPRDYGMLPEVRKSVRKYVSGLLNCNES